MVDIIFNKIKFSSKGPFVLYDWKDSKEPYMGDFGANICFFIKDKEPKKVLEKFFINQMKSFDFRADFEKRLLLEGVCADGNFNYIFAKYSGSRFPEFNWTRYKHPLKRDTNLSFLKNETEILKYLSKYIDKEK